MGFRKFVYWGFEIHIELFEGTHPLDFDPSQLKGGESRRICGYKVL
jgi:hypothetical protein